MLWNLSNFTDLQPKVTEAAGTQVRKVARGGKRTAQFRVGMVAALVATTISLGTVAGTSSQMNIPVHESVVNRVYGVESKTPLSHLFGDKFDTVWTAELEEGLLAKIAAKYPAASASSNQDFVDALYSNQQEALSEDIPRLSRDQIRGVIKRRSA